VVPPTRPVQAGPHPAAPPVRPGPAGGGGGAGGGGTRPASAARPPVNPFLAQDPKQKARRLARALISDLVVYHPEKRQEGLRNGTLKDLFGDEIKKSWEEYTEQVGQQVAESTSYFNDALNEILGDGRKIF
jgi:hypothetical protein